MPERNDGKKVKVSGEVSLAKIDGARALAEDAKFEMWATRPSKLGKMATSCIICLICVICVVKDAEAGAR